jgi:hypothetical protein
MLYRDTDLSRQLVSERHAELKQDWRTANAAAAAPVETLSNLRSRFAWVRAHPRLAKQTPARHAS